MCGLVAFKLENYRILGDSRHCLTRILESSHRMHPSAAPYINMAHSRVNPMPLCVIAESRTEIPRARRTLHHQRICTNPERKTCTGARSHGDRSDDSGSLEGDSFSFLELLQVCFVAWLWPQCGLSLDLRKYTKEMAYIAGWADNPRLRPATAMP
jgi:hypothetical protein